MVEIRSMGELLEFLKQHRFCIVILAVTGCPACQEMHEMLSRVERDVPLAIVHLDRYEDLARWAGERLHIDSVPCVLVKCGDDVQLWRVSEVEVYFRDEWPRWGEEDGAPQES